MNIDQNKEDKINKGEHRSKNVTPTFKKREQIKRWVKKPTPKQIEHEDIDRK